MEAGAAYKKRVTRNTGDGVMLISNRKAQYTFKCR
jgi:hypothetical protein